MEIVKSALPDVLVLKPRIFADERGHFFEAYNRREFETKTGLRVSFVQDNVSRSQKGVLRGLHYQNPQPQGKLVRVLAGEIYDVVVDIRRDSPTFAQSTAIRLSADNALMVWVPAGFAHGFLALSDFADVLYKTTDYYAPQHEHCIVWNDPQLAIEWPLTGPPELSPKDRRGKLLKDSAVFA
jgi:dTDP-4-dehydrorhamnose 3,5-epimerase